MVKVGTILSGFERGDFYSYIVASLDDYEGVALIISIQPRSYGCNDRITIRLHKIKYNCFDLEDTLEAIMWDWEDICKDEKQQNREDKYEKNRCS
tara:strand:+ start:1345 stop:1629 length:285 start_codon:yes stop_codon:yes gene_type:complete